CVTHSSRNTMKASTPRRKSVQVPVVDPLRFVEATRDSGYRDVAAAVAELVDNAIQAEAGQIEILVRESPDRRSDFDIVVLDNGEGIAPERLARALQFGGTHRFNARTGLG